MGIIQLADVSKAAVVFVSFASFEPEQAVSTRDAANVINASFLNKDFFIMIPPILFLHLFRLHFQRPVRNTSQDSSR